MNPFAWIPRLFAKPIPRPSLPPAGQSSAKPETLADTFAYAYAQYSDDYNLVEVLRILENLSKVDGIYSDYMRRITDIINTGHETMAEGPASERAKTLVDDLAATIYPLSYGTDGLVSQLVRQIEVNGCISIEAVLSRDLRRVEKIVLVPPREVRFKYQNNAWQPYQLHNGKEYKLNPITYIRINHLFDKDDSPYALPLGVAVIRAIKRHDNTMINLDNIANIAGLFGIVDYSVERPQQMPGESLAAYTSRVKTELENTSKAVKSSFKNGVLVHYEDQKIGVTSTASQLRGSAEMNQIVEEKVFSGLSVDPSTCGRSNHVTETYAAITHEMLAQRAKKTQQIIARALERVYNLHLLLQGVNAEIGVKFNPPPEFSKTAAEERSTMKQNRVIQAVKEGLVSPERGANELGYDEWFDEDKINYAATNNSNDIGLEKPHSPFAHAGEQKNTAGNSQSATFAKKLTPAQQEAAYKSVLKKYMAQAGVSSVEAAIELLRRTNHDMFTSADDFAEAIKVEVLGKYRKLETNEAFLADLTKIARKVYNTSRFKDAKITYKGQDQRITTFVAACDRFYVSRFMDNDKYGSSVVNWLKEQYNTKGIDLWGRMNAETIQDFRNEFEKKLSNTSDASIKRIINTSLQQIRNFGEIEKLYELDIEQLEVFAVMEELACPICREFHGRVVSVQTARNYTNSVLKMNSDEYLEHLRSRSKTYQDMTTNVRGVSMADITAKGYGIPPFHPNCKCIVQRHRVVQQTNPAGYDVNMAENGNPIEFVPPDNVKSKHSVKYTINDVNGQKIYVSDQAYRQTKTERGADFADEIPAIIAKGKVTVKKSDPMTTVYSHKGKVAVVRSDGRKLVWSVFDDNNNYAERWQKED